MNVYKFGGSSLGSAERIENVAQIILSAADKPMVVVSAVGDTTNLLEEAIDKAVETDGDYTGPYGRMKQQHLDIARNLFSPSTQPGVIGKMHLEFKKGENVLEGINILNEATEKSKDRILSIGEQVASFLVSEYLKTHSVHVTLLDAQSLIKIKQSDKKREVIYEPTLANVKGAVAELEGIGVVPGFIGSAEDGSVRIMGRGGSDLTASIIAEAIQAEVLTLWSDVSGLYTADPRIVPDAFCIDELSYEEALEMSYFGAGILYPPAVLPALRNNIPIQIKNSFYPEEKGTRIVRQTRDERIVKGISSIKDISMVTLIGGGMVGVAGIASRTFTCLSENHINVIFISQSSSEHSICIGIQSEDKEDAVSALNREFSYEINTKMIDSVAGESGFAIIALVGQNMLNTPGISGKLFQSLGSNGVNVHAIAQGSSERNISSIIKESDVEKALNLLHEDFFLSEVKKIHLYIAGTGNVGKQFIRLIYEQQDEFREEFNLEFKLIGMINSRKMLIKKEGIDWGNAVEEIESNVESANWQDFFRKMVDFNLRNTVFVDNTASEGIGNVYDQLLQHSISIATCNKIAASGDYTNYSRLKKMAHRNRAHFLFETNVGAGLPILSTIRNLKKTGDRIDRIDAVLSGSMNFILNKISEDQSFYQSLQEAMKMGYTEPDPRTDLLGTDAMRKMIILAREAGYPIEQQDVDLISFLPEKVEQASSVEAFIESVQENDALITEKWQEDIRQGKKLRFVSTLDRGEVRLGVDAFPKEHPFYDLDNADNIILLHTRWYNEQPLVIKGAGAGVDVTASGVLNDVFEIVQHNNY
ncbi:MAG: bifunctional aspartate kinase/homoserine dehydrogenase I [Bacteroidales bacterium]